MRKYKGIDIGRVIFACLIPLLHIGMSDPVSFIVKQYVSRLGVPFFFAVAGMFLSRTIEKSNGVAALKKYIFKIGRMLLIWLVIYLPILMLRQEGLTIRELLFKTPAYFWYLTALLVASIPFCLVRNRKGLLYVSLALYAFGTVFGEAYSQLTGGLPVYESIFITTRNGVFFGLPMMCIGEASWNREKISPPEFLVMGGVYSRGNVRVSPFRTRQYVSYFAGAHLFPDDCTSYLESECEYHMVWWNQFSHICDAVWYNYVHYESS